MEAISDIPKQFLIHCHSTHHETWDIPHITEMGISPMISMARDGNCKANNTAISSLEKNGTLIGNCNCANYDVSFIVISMIEVQLDYN